MSKKKYAVLLVEDSEIIQCGVSMQLNRLRCKVDIAANGETAKKMAAEMKYDLIITDIGLPDIKGYEVSEYIRKTLKLTTPIIAYSSCDDWKEACFNAGVSDFKLKPLSNVVLQSILKEWVKEYSQDILVK